MLHELFITQCTNGTSIMNPSIRTIIIQKRKRASQCYIWSVLLYGSETWTLTKVIQNKLEAFEMWIYRRMMRISWTEQKSNEEVLEMTISKMSLIVTIKKENSSILDILSGKIVYKDYYLKERLQEREDMGDPEQCGWITSRIGLD